ncbi:NUDIX domain-containing protein [Rhizobium sp. LC145]|jgi:predicted NUDIX family NTP pyrophosphohydrolase|uniref:NUDIX domain-containing protein n=1 Tax=Rhizobium sp. LC145 TaxID=1120688 RepID=UPI00062A2FA3|nr:NUDIX domain-containing protein [Rhizobium sp. LC145]KKX28206.1 NUDIX hydrolase [Rhizobium sp. LC145]TKT46205.1 NUDIX domain-containing protein [Rhizobiaceae bacterium LC148]
MPQRSAGLLIHRLKGGERQVFLVHPGGPFWARKDEGAWSIPKGLIDEGEDELTAARREVMEEVGATIEGTFEWLGEYRQPGGKRVLAWAVEADIDIDPETIASNMFTMEWPPRSGQFREFPEVDRAGWFSLSEAQAKILKGQKPMLADLAEHLGQT